MRDAVRAHLVHDLLDRAVHRAEGDDDRFRIIGAIRAQQAARLAPELTHEGRGQPGDHRERPQLLVMREIAHFGERLGTDHRADADRIARIEHLPRLVRRQERIDLLLRRHVDTVIGVSEDEPVHAHHHRTGELLGEAKRLNVQVERLLIGFRVKLDPAGVAHRHAVGVIVPDVDRSADRTVADRHHDRQAEAGGVVDRLRHEQQPLAAGRRISAHAGGRGTDRHRKRGELGFDVDELAVRLPCLDHLAQPLDDVRLGSDRIRADDLRPTKGDGLGDCVRPFCLLKHRCFPSSAPPSGRLPSPRRRSFPRWRAEISRGSRRPATTA